MALEASAELRDTRGFISITTSSPVSRLSANCTFEPPVSTPTARITRAEASRSTWYSRSVSVWAGATVTESPVWTPIGSTFSIEQITTTLSFLSRITSSSNSPQPATDSSSSTWLIGLSRRPRRDDLVELLDGRREAAALTAQRERGPDHDRQRQRPSSSAARASSRLCAIALTGTRRPIDSIVAREQLAVLGAVDCVVGGADQLDAELIEQAGLGQQRGQVERGLAAQRRQQRVRPLGGSSTDRTPSRSSGSR